MSESYDYDAGAHLSGVRQGQIYHYGRSAHIDLKVSGSQFSGYDFSSGSHFSGHVSGNSISLFDYGVGSYFDYSI